MASRLDDSFPTFYISVVMRYAYFHVMLYYYTKFKCLTLNIVTVIHTKGVRVAAMLEFATFCY
jgi:hypothetical protein